MLDFQGRGALVTGAGASDGIGYATARLLAESGAAVFLVSLGGRAVDRAQELTAAGHLAYGASCDLTDPDAVKALMQEVHARLPALHVVVNNAGMTSTAGDLARSRERSTKLSSPAGGQVSPAILIPLSWSPKLHCLRCGPADQGESSWLPALPAR